MRLREGSPEKDREVEATLANIRHTTSLEMAESENASFLECFKGTNLRRTEIVSTIFILAVHGVSVPLSGACCATLIDVAHAL